MTLAPGAALAQAPEGEPGFSPEGPPPESAAFGMVTITPYGRLRASYDWVQDDPDTDFVGDNSGFSMRSARIGFLGAYGPDKDVRFDLSLEAATELRDRFNDPNGELEVRAVDANVVWVPHEYLNIAMGQFKLPFDYENWRSAPSLPFASRAVGYEGVAPGFGFEERGIVVNRGVGVRFMPDERIRFGAVGFEYILAVTNGSGDNRVLNDNNKPAFFGRLEVDYDELVYLGGGFLYNERTAGELPNLFDEKDLGFTADIRVEWKGLEVLAQVTHLTTEFDTIAADDRVRLAYHAQANYEFDLDFMLLAPGYRFAVFEPWFGADDTDDAGISLEDFKLTHHTIGLRASHPSSWLDLFVNYTITQEEGSRELDNDRLEILSQVAF